ncbi:unnamed protein product, partial [Anisakis simplex]|uniref:FMRFamide receptor (inferred by orthology to a D. melanogaster protein) n=1 Tax=Anisakis simplex TaxID=6269 RepID=A0A0M3K3K2_ANISI
AFFIDGNIQRALTSTVATSIHAVEIVAAAICCCSSFCSKAVEYEAEGVLALPFIVIGLMANAMSIRIFSHRHMRMQCVNWYLMLLAASDSVILIGAFFVLTLPRLGEVLHWWSATAISYYSTPYMYAFMTLAQTVSVWMTTAMSIHRFVGVCFPFKAGELLTERNVKTLIFCVIVASVLFNSTRFFEVYIADVCYMQLIGAELPVLLPTELRMDPLYRKIFYEWAYTLIMFAIPFTILIVVNTLVIIAVHRYFHLLIVFAFVVNILEKLDMNELYAAAVPWSNMLVMTNASINICIYCMFSDKYRQLFSLYIRSFLCCSKVNKDDSFQMILTSH